MILIDKSYKLLNLALLIAILLLVDSGFAQSLPLKCFENQKDYSYMWWLKSIKSDNNKIFAIKTNHYALSFDYPNLSINNLVINKNPGSEEIALRETNTESFQGNNPCKISFGMETNEGMQWCSSTTKNIDDCQLIETGKYFQRRFINKLSGLTDCDIYNSGLEISSWPDRLTFILKVTPGIDLHNQGLRIELTFPPEFSVLIEKGDVKALKNPRDGSGFVVLKSENSTNIEVSGKTVKVKLGKNAECPAGIEMNTGIIIYPVANNIDLKLAEISEQENQPVIITAAQISPVNKILNVVYDKDHGWHHVSLRNDGYTEAGSESGNNRIERVKLAIDNPSSIDKIVRLNFAKGRLSENGGTVFGITGISAILRDVNGNPVGIPVQLSKNWHRTGFDGISTHYFRGPWYHGLSMLTIPANTRISLEYTSVNGLWGGAPAASHAQLCLVGWGINQQWDESAIGSWGETICYEPDLYQADAPLLDFRPLMLKNSADQKWGWTGNMGGADFFNYTKTTGIRGWHCRMRTQYKRIGPNYTEVTYAGTMDDNSMDFEYTASIGRSDDISRGIYHIKLIVLNNITFKDFVVFQTAAPTYHFTKSNTLAWGNETGLKEQWIANIGATSKYIRPKQIAEGKIPWFSFTDSQFTGPPDDFRPANRGFVIRSWNARINGKDNIPPWFAEYNTSSGNHGDPSGLINITPPDGCTSFQAGDYIDAVIELFQLPKLADDYYGPNQNLIKALHVKSNTWEMAYREAIGNDLEVKTAIGGALSIYPIKIETNNNSARFLVTGGCGYIPLTITSVSNYENPELFRKSDGNWQKINQAVYGNDYWQTEFNAVTGKWEITYNVNLDSPDDIRQKVEFKFESIK